MIEKYNDGYIYCGIRVIKIELEKICEQVIKVELKEVCRQKIVVDSINIAVIVLPFFSFMIVIT